MYISIIKREAMHMDFIQNILDLDFFCFVYLINNRQSKLDKDKIKLIRFKIRRKSGHLAKVTDELCSGLKHNQLNKTLKHVERYKFVCGLFVVVVAFPQYLKLHI